ncbi:hypothetical protein [Xanthobacter variabilis]|uniref:hypothetical protein n=1 Tax=Xanthobacter variabilis TaxID=3119932 RepID=UPI00372A6941
MIFSRQHPSTAKARRSALSGSTSYNTLSLLSLSALMMAANVGTAAAQQVVANNGVNTPINVVTDGGNGTDSVFHVFESDEAPTPGGGAGAVSATATGTIDSDASGNVIAISAKGGNGGNATWHDLAEAGTFNGQNGGGAGNVTVTSSANLFSSGGAGALGIISITADGGSGGNAANFSSLYSSDSLMPYSAGTGGAGATVTVTLSAGPDGSPSLVHQNSDAPAGLAAVYVSASGGAAGQGDQSSEGDYGSWGGNGGYAGTVTVHADKVSILTISDQSAGIHAIADGGAGGNGGYTQDDTLGISGLGGDSGGGGTVTVTLGHHSSINTQGDFSVGILAEANDAPAGSAGLGGNSAIPGGTAIGGGWVTVLNDGTIKTQGNGAHGIVAQAGGSSGGDGTTSYGVIYSVAGSGGVGGDGGTLTVTNSASGTITTSGSGSYGIIAQSIAGTGGNAGDAESLAISIGGDGGNAGNGGSVTVDNAGSITTSGTGAAGIAALSIGGGGGILLGEVAQANMIQGSSTSGGAGGTAVTLLGPFSLGGHAGGGGDGGDVTVSNTGKIEIEGSNSIAIQAQSIGGGGGNGGGSYSESLFASVSIGGNGGDGGKGGAVTINPTSAVDLSTEAAPAVTGKITLHEHDSYGIYASSIGGGGGDGGSTTGVALGVPVAGLDYQGYSFQFALGGSGGSGGDGGAVTVNNISEITALDENTVGVFVQSVGGGGGTGGSATGVSVALGDFTYAPVPSISAAVDIGGSGGNGGDGGTVTVNNYAKISTVGDMSPALLAESIGGGGGNGGNATALSAAVNGAYSASVSVAIGGKGGSGGVGGQVDVVNTAALSTQGQFSDALYAQSVGGGGGNGGSGAAYAIPGLLPIGYNFTGTVGVGGRGGSGGDGGAVTVTNYGAISTLVQGSRGIFAQSVGGGGGNGGGGQSVGISNFESVQVGVGGSGGAAGDGGAVTVTNTASGSIETHAAGGNGIVAQSVGGGGGTGGAASASQSFSTTTNVGRILKAYSSKISKTLSADKLWGRSASKYSFSQQVNVGGSGGAGGNGGAVSVENDGKVTTHGDSANGILAQSVGGGGGVGGAASGAGGALANLDINVGGSGGDDGPAHGSGGTVNVTNTAAISTGGDYSAGIFAQSVGGGGGAGGSAMDGTYASGVVSVDVGGSEGASGNGGKVTVTSTGAISTKGYQSHGILAQSIGGGGGTSQINLEYYQYVDEVDPTSGLTVSHPEIVLDSTVYGGGSSATGGNTGSSGVSLGIATTIGGSGGAGGSGAEVDVTVGSTITTAGKDAYGVFAQSVGGGGGTSGSDSGAIAAIDNHVDGSGGNAGDGGAVNVTLKAGLQINTKGMGAAGIVAQSIGGGGGLVGGVSDGLSLQWGGNWDNEGGNGGHGGDITITNDSGTASITTAGRGAHGIFAQSVGGGGGAAGSSEGLLSLGGGVNGQSRHGGQITIDYAGDISAKGVNSIAIFAESTGANVTAPGTTANGIIAVTTNGTIAGGSGSSGAGIALVGGGSGIAQNTINVNGGSVSAGENGYALAFLSQAASTVAVVNSGTITGNIDLGRAANTFENNGTLYSGANVIINNSTGGSYWTPISSDLLADGSPSGTLGPVVNGDTFTNAGTINPFGTGVIGTTTLDTSDYVQTKTGLLQVDVDFNTQAADLLHVTGAATLDGKVAPQLTSLPTASAVRDGASVTILTAHDAVAGNLTPVNTIAASYATVIEGKDVAVKLTSLNFANSSVVTTASQNIASNLQSAWTSGTTGQLGSAMAALANLPAGSAAAYNKALEGLSGEGSAVGSAKAPARAQAFAHALHSCPVFVGETAKLMEESCVWSQVVGDHYTETNSSGIRGYDNNWGAFQVGGQKALEDNWFVGGALSIGQATLTSDDGTYRDNSDNYSVGLVLKKRILDVWEIAASATYTYNTGDSKRVVASAMALTSSGLFPTAMASPDTHTFGGRLRFAYYADLGAFYLKPYADLDAAYVYAPAYNEVGAGNWNLHYASASDFQVAVSPNLEIGSRINTELGVLRAYARGGVSLWSDGDWSQTAWFEGMGLGDTGHTNTFNGSEFYGKGVLGAELVSDNGLAFRFEYTLSGDNDFLNQNFAGRLGYRF